jgi:hypothetical protein
MYLLILSYIPLIESLRPERYIISDIRQKMSDSDKISIQRDFGHLYSFLFYTRMPIFIYDSNEILIDKINSNEKTFVIMRKKDFEEHSHRLKVPIVTLREKNKVIIFYSGNNSIKKTPKKNSGFNQGVLNL